jgi:glutathione-regulated potassium-efflux system ancillary protein KefC
MTSVWALAALWLGLAAIATLLSIWLRVSTALSEIAVGTIAQFIFGFGVLGTDEPWVKFLSGLGAIVLTFLAGAELDPQVFKLKWKETATVGLASFLFPFLGCAGAAHYLLGWQVMPSWLAGVAMSTTSVAVVYAVMLEFGFNATEYGKTILAACFVTDLGTVVALGLIFAISSLFGLSHGIIDKSQYSALVAAVIGSAVIPTVIANAFYLPRHLLPKTEMEDMPAQRQAPATKLLQLVRRAE